MCGYDSFGSEYDKNNVLSMITWEVGPHSVPRQDSGKGGRVFTGLRRGMERPVICFLSVACVWVHLVPFTSVAMSRG